MVDTQVRPSDVTVKFSDHFERDAATSRAKNSCPARGVSGVSWENLLWAGPAPPPVLEARTLAKMLGALDLQRTDLRAQISGCLDGDYSSAVGRARPQAVVWGRGGCRSWWPEGEAILAAAIAATMSSWFWGLWREWARRSTIGPY